MLLVEIRLYKEARWHGVKREWNGVFHSMPVNMLQRTAITDIFEKEGGVHHCVFPEN